MNWINFRFHPRWALQWLHFHFEIDFELELFILFHLPMACWLPSQMARAFKLSWRIINSWKISQFSVEATQQQQREKTETTCSSSPENEITFWHSLSLRLRTIIEIKSISILNLFFSTCTTTLLPLFHSLIWQKYQTFILDIFFCFCFILIQHKIDVNICLQSLSTCMCCKLSILVYLKSYTLHTRRECRNNWKVQLDCNRITHSHSWGTGQ